LGCRGGWCDQRNWPADRFRLLVPKTPKREAAGPCHLRVWKTTSDRVGARRELRPHPTHKGNWDFKESNTCVVFNEGDEDIADCNIRLIASTPVLNIGDFPATYPIFFGAHFDLAPKKRKFIEILRFAESGAMNPLERDYIFISAAVGGIFWGVDYDPHPTGRQSSNFDVGSLCAISCIYRGPPEDMGGQKEWAASSCPDYLIPLQCSK
jgi:hypothetical protein